MADDFVVSMLMKVIDRATAPMRRVTKNFEQMGAAKVRADKHFKRAADMRQAAAGVATVASKMRGALLGPISASEDFGASIAKLKGVSQLGEKAMGRLRVEALRLGKSVGEFDPTGVVKGMTELSKASFTEAEIMEAIPSLLDLSTTSGGSLADTIKTVTDVMGGFGLKAKDTASAADIMTAAANASKTDFNGLAETMSFSGLIMKKAGFNMKEAAIAAGVLANASLGASRGGTALTGVLAALSGARRGPGKKILGDMGIEMEEFRRGAIRLRNPVAILADVQKKIDHLSPKAQLEEFGRIFGQSAQLGAAALADAAGELGLDKLNTAVNNATGRTKQMAEAFRATAENETLQLTSAITTLNIALGDGMAESVSKAKSSVKGAVEMLQGLVEEYPKITKWTMISFGATALFATGLAVAMFTLSAATTALGVMALAFGVNKTGTELMGAGLRKVVLGMKRFGVAIWTRGIAPMLSWVGTMFTTMFPAFTAWAATLWGTVVTSVTGFATTVWTRAIPAMVAWTAKMWASVPAALAVAAPFIAIGAAIAGVSLAIIELVKHWEKLDVMEGLKGMMSSFSEEGVLSTVGGLLDPRTLLKDIGVLSSGVASPQSVSAPQSVTAPALTPGSSKSEAKIQVGLAEGLQLLGAQTSGDANIETQTMGLGALLPAGGL